MTKIKYNEKYLERRFRSWALVELKMYLDELEQKIKNNTITNDEILCVQPVREEIERRTKMVNSINKAFNEALKEN